MEEDHAQSVILRNVLSEMLGEDSDDEEEVEDEVFTTSAPIPPLHSTHSLVRNPTIRKPRLTMRRYTTWSQITQASFTQQSSSLNPFSQPALPPGPIPSQVKVPQVESSSSKVRRKSKMLERWMLRRRTIATANTDGRKLSSMSGVKGFPLAIGMLGGNHALKYVFL